MAYNKVAFFISIFLLIVLSVSVSLKNAHHPNTQTTTVEKKKYTAENEKSEKVTSQLFKRLQAKDDCDDTCSFRIPFDCDIDLGCVCNFDKNRCEYRPSPPPPLEIGGSNAEFDPTDDAVCKSCECC